MKNLTVIAFILVIWGLGNVKAKNCNNLTITQCCNLDYLTDCFEKCQPLAIEHCPEMYHSRFGTTSMSSDTIRRSPKSMLFRPLSLSQRYKRFGMCGTRETNYIPCISRWKADYTFRACCEKYVDKACHGLCHYETSEFKALSTLRAAKKNGCSFVNLSAILYCAAQNRDNRQCCEHMDFGTDDTSNCMRFCNPSEEKIAYLSQKDAVCVRNWNVFMYCHLSGLT